MNNLMAELESLMTGHWLSDLPNFCALFYHRLPDISWIGFYLNDGKSLKLGPFQGKIACTDIAFERGVCGTAFSMQQTLIVKDVHEFPGHIACDADSNSEIVLPITMEGKKIGVLDIDSKSLGRFTESDKVFFEEALDILMKKSSLAKFPHV
jgi:GAF domain-containing protein